MKSKHIVILLGITAILVVSAFIVTRHEQPVTTANASTTPAFFPQLANKLNDITVIETRQGNDAVHVEHGDGGWRVKEKHDYPADFAKVRQTLLALSELKPLEAKTKHKENYARLGVQDPGAGSPAKQLEVHDGTGKYSAALIVGNARAMGSSPGVYVRKPDDAQTWLAQGSLYLPANAAQWLEKSILDISPARVKAVTIHHGNKVNLRVFKNKEGDADFQVKGLPKGKTLKSPSAANNIASALQGLSLQDVVAAHGFDFDGKKAVNTRFETFDGLVISAAVLTKDNKHYARFSVSFDEHATAQDKDDKKHPTPVDKPKTEAESLNAKLKPWVYEIAAYRADNLTRKLDDLIK